MDGRPKQRVVGMYAPRRALARGAAGALERLGYRLAAIGRGGETEAPDARIAAERELRRIPREDRAPLILLEGRFPKRAQRRRDPRLVATLRKPANLVDLYRALQLALEENPRRAPRAAITLPARCVSGEHDWPGAIVSLSEGGCLVRSAPDPRVPPAPAALVPAPRGRPGRGDRPPALPPRLPPRPRVPRARRRDAPGDRELRRRRARGPRLDRAVAPLPVRVAQLALVELAVRVARHLGDEVDRLRRLVLGELVAAEGEDLRR